MTTKYSHAVYLIPCMPIFLILATTAVLVCGNTTMSTKLTTQTEFPFFSESTELFLEYYIPWDMTYFHEWDKAKQSAKEYQDEYCFIGCLDNVTIRQSKTCLNLDCFPCDCEKPMCQHYGTCCPDISGQSEVVGTVSSNVMMTQPLLTSHTDAKVKPETNMSADDLKLSCQNVGSSFISYLFIHSCPGEYSKADVREKCESQLPINEMSVESFTHVSDNETGVSYFNEYCAICNQVSQFVRWQLQIDCVHYLQVYTATTYDELLRLALYSNSECLVSQEPPEHLDLKYCNPHWYGDPISECNVTGKWLEYDEVLNKECRQYQNMYNKKYDEENSQLYSNIFCFICNTNTFPTYARSCYRNEDMIASRPVILPFSLLFNFHRKPSGSKILQNLFKGQICLQDEWRSPSGSCLPLECSPGKVLEGKNCSTALQDITGLGYYLRHFYLLKVPNVKGGMENPQNSLDEVSLYPYLIAIEREVSKYLSEMELDFTVFYENPLMVKQTGVSTFSNEKNSNKAETETSRSNVSVALILMDAYLSGNSFRDDFENKIISELMSKIFFIELEDQVPVSVMPLPVMSTRDLLNCSSLPSDYQTLNCFSDGKYVLFGNNFQMFEVKNQFLTLSVVMTCAHVKFNRSEYVLEYDNTVFPPFRQIVLYFDSNVIPDITFDTEQELSQMMIEEGGTLKMCEDLLSSKVSQIVEPLIDDMNNDSSIKEYQYILTLICASLSMICLLLTLMTYFLFPKLRSAAGQNNIFLCLTLLLAQASLLATSHTEGPSPFCTALGITTHFLWLSMFSWSFICCWNMFRVFTAKTRKAIVSLRSEGLALIKKVTICSLVPAMIIIIVIITITLSTNGNRTGYGDSICYLDSGLLVGIALVAPLGLILLCNISFFTVVIIKIHNVRKLQKHAEFQRDDRDNLYVYVKLSTLTGAFWGLMIIAEITENDTIIIISIILNGLQGVFIFLSYVCNKRVFHMYLRGMGLEKHTTSTSTERSTIHRVASEMNKRNLKSDDIQEKKHSHKNTSAEEAPPEAGIKTVASDLILYS